MTKFLYGLKPQTKVSFLKKKKRGYDIQRLTVVFPTYTGRLHQSNRSLQTVVQFNSTIHLTGRGSKGRVVVRDQEQRRVS